MEAAFDAGRVTSDGSDGGLLLLRELLMHTGLLRMNSGVCSIIEIKPNSQSAKTRGEDRTASVSSCSRSAGLRPTPGRGLRTRRAGRRCWPGRVGRPRGIRSRSCARRWRTSAEREHRRIDSSPRTRASTSRARPRARSWRPAQRRGAGPGGAQRLRVSIRIVGIKVVSISTAAPPLARTHHNPLGPRIEPIRPPRRIIIDQSIRTIILAPHL